MRFRRTLGEPDEPVELNLIPLIDVIMFLLIFFISTTSLMEDHSLTVDKPQPGGNSSSSEDQTIILAITRDGKVTHLGKEIGLDGVMPTVRRLCGREALPVVIQTDEKSRSGLVIRVIDAAKLGGAKDVSLAMNNS